MNKKPHELICPPQDYSLVAWIHWAYTSMVRPLLCGIAKGFGNIFGIALIRYLLVGPVFRLYKGRMTLNLGAENQYVKTLA